MHYTHCLHYQPDDLPTYLPTYLSIYAPYATLPKTHVIEPKDETPQIQSQPSAFNGSRKQLIAWVCEKSLKTKCRGTMNTVTDKKMILGQPEKENNLNILFLLVSPVLLTHHPLHFHSSAL